MRNLSESLEQIRKDMQKQFDNEIMKYFMGVAAAEVPQKSAKEILSDLNDMIVEMTTLIMCNSKNKKLIEEKKRRTPANDRGF